MQLTLHVTKQDGTEVSLNDLRSDDDGTLFVFLRHPG
ncbi:hypothetical protein B0H94_1104 [Salsuginibacillus halophilus]|uniref:Uncharacterized protein n=1 Tax=Salsuginibacillus halophilus TaxID=517424 RepID=A0A2P8HBF5_9BACI|nr:hypothetical protein B0H94_1104 [Salsuginibacillus halophilus]